MESEITSDSESNICEEVDVFFASYKRYFNHCVDLCNVERFLQFFDFVFTMQASIKMTTRRR